MILTRTAFLALGLVLSFAEISHAGNYRVASTLSAGAFAEDHSEFGSSLAADGEWLLVGQPLTADGGAVHFFRKSGLNWVFFTRFVMPPADNSPSGGRFGSAVAIQGNTAIIGAEFAGPEKVFGLGDGLAYACEFNGTTWNLVQRIAPQFTSGADSHAFGRTVSLEGEILIVSGPQGTINGRANAGVSQVYRRVAGVWTTPTDPAIEIFSAGPPVGAGPESAWQLGRRADLKGDYALLTATAPNANTDDPGIYGYFNNTSGPGAPSFESVLVSGLLHPIRPEPALSEAMAIQRFTALAMLNDAEAITARVESALGPPVSPLSVSLVPLTRSARVWTYGELIDLPGFTTVNFMKVEGNDPLALFGSGEDRRVAIARKTGGIWSVTETLPTPAGSDDSFGNFGTIQGTTLFAAAHKADQGGTDRGLVHVYERSPEISAIGKRSFKTTKMKIILKGSSSEVSSVVYQFGKGGLKNAKGSPTAWSIPVNLNEGKNLIKVIGKGPGGSTSPLTFKVRRLGRK